MRQPPTSEKELLIRVRNLRVWTRNGERAPHKPLLLLYALGRMEREGTERLISYDELREPVGRLLREFGPRGRHQPPTAYEPFVHLCSDGLWEIEGLDQYKKVKGKPYKPTRTSLANDGPAWGGFPEAVERLLRANPALGDRIAKILIERHFTPRYEEDLLGAVGLDEYEEAIDEEGRERKKRDRRFREQILDAYGCKCAVCEMDMRVRGRLVGIEAAHIRWHNMEGPSSVDNGLALCAMHHKAFDYGAFTLDRELRLVPSEQLVGGAEAQRAILERAGHPIHRPREDQLPAEPYLRWHREQVFCRRPSPRPYR